MKVFIINIKESSERRKTMSAQLEGMKLDWEFFTAFDGRKMTDEEKKSVYDDSIAFRNVGRQMSNGEIGCAMSHRLVYKKIIDENIQDAVILEDDVLLSKDFEKIILKLSQVQLTNSVVKLEDRCEKLYTSKWNKFTVDETYKVSKLVDKNAFGAYGYYIDNLAARTLYSLTKKIINVSDHWVFYSKYIRVCKISPSLVRIDPSYHSDIWAYEDTSVVTRTRKRYPRGINFIVRNFKKINLSFIKQFLP